jgi:hypothetical protein
MFASFSDADRLGFGTFFSEYFCSVSNELEYGLGSKFQIPFRGTEIIFTTPYTQLVSFLGLRMHGALLPHPLYSLISQYSLQRNLCFSVKITGLNYNSDHTGQTCLPLCVSIIGALYLSTH